MKLIIKHGRVVDPVNNRDGIMDILIDRDKIKRVAKNISEDGEIVDAKGMVVIPGIVDMHVHLREPGREDEETVETGCSAAARGGVTSILCMPNTNPPIDNASLVQFVIKSAMESGKCNVYPSGAITKGLNGEELAEVGEMVKEGAMAITDDGKCVMDSQVMRRALEYSRIFNIVVISHCEDANLSGNGVMNEGFISTKLGLKGIPNAAEEVMVARDLFLGDLTKGRLHVAHVSTRDSVELVRMAKLKGTNVTAEVTPHHFTLDDTAVEGFNANTKTNPPLRSVKDVEKLKEGLKEGVIDVIASDHAPHIQAEKEMEYDNAPFGIIGIETLLPLVITELVKPGVLSLPEAVRKITCNPAKVIGINKGALSEGADADLTIFDMEKEYTISKEDIVSKSKNTPFIGKRVYGKVQYTILGGQIVYKAI